MEPLNIIRVGEHQYHIDRFSSKTGSWLLMRFAKAFRQLISGLDDEDNETSKPEKEIGDKEFSESLLQTLLSELNEKDFGEIQIIALRVVSRTDFVGDKAFQQPIIMHTGKFAFAELNDDIGAVMSLTSEAIFANLAPYFTQAGLKAIMSGKIPIFSR